MTNEEQNLITGLFDRLRNADKAPKDRDAERFIQERVGAQPTAPYLMAQTVLVQEQALNNAQARIKDLETRLADVSKSQQHEGTGGGSFLSGLFGGNKQSANNPPAQQPAPPPMPPAQQAGGGGYAPAGGYPPNSPVAAPAAGGGFLRTALAAAAGVAGGSLLANGLENMLGHHGGMFGSSMGTGGNFMNTGFGGGQPTETVNETVNNYYDNEDRGGGNAGFGGGDAISNTSDRDADNDNDPYSTPPTDDPSEADPDNSTASGDSGDYSTPPTDEPNDGGSFASSDDSGSSYDSGGGSDDNLV